MAINKDTIFKILLGKKNGLHVDEISDEFITRGLDEELGKDDLKKNINRILIGDVKRKKGSVFKKVPNGKGGYKKGFYKIIAEKKPKGTPTPGDIILPPTNCLFTGRAGEHAVLSELLFREFNASIMAVDQGIDIVASKGKDFYYIQIKTANFRNGSFYATVDKKQFERYNFKDTFYILVLRYLVKNEKQPRTGFIVFKSSDLEVFKNKGVIGNAENLNISIKICDGKIVLNNREDITLYFNFFDYIK
ncbi:MAG: hypothetical protein WCW77_00090 [Patescibacteria group bacterium]|jgi:hypothetical protein